MKLGIRLKLFVVSLSLIALSFVAADAYLTRGVSSRLTSNIQDDLRVRAQLAARDASVTQAPLDDVAAWDALADSVGGAADARITIIRKDGVVIGDSDVPLADLKTVENHRTRPEVESALSTGYGADSRTSATVHQSLMYVAVPFRGSDGAVVGVARAARPLSAVDDAIGQLRRLIALASFFAIAVAVAMSSFAANWMSRTVRDLTDAARRMTAGDLNFRTHVRGKDELAELGHALDQLAGSLSQTLTELRTERDLQRHILDGMQEGVLVLDRDGRIVMMNPALRGMLLLGTHVNGKLLMEVVRHADLHELVQRAREGRTTALGEIDLPGIKPRRLLTHATAFAGFGADPAGAATTGGLLAVFVDVTDLRRLESLRRDFVANVSHELRTPVTAIRSAAETLQESALKDPDPAVAVRFVDIVSRNAERLQSLIEDLLELSKLESKEFRLKKESLELSVVATIVLGLFRGRAEKKGVRLGVSLPPDLPTLVTDQRALEQVVSNLVDNAVKYCPPGSQVTIAAEKTKTGICISVRDTGPGIDPKHMPRLFERFYRVDAGRSREIGGTGLGLSIVKHLVEAMGGEVTVESVVGRGSTFVVTLPQPAT